MVDTNMKTLDQVYFIRPTLLEAVRVMPGTRTNYDNGVWEFVGYNDGKQGGTWRIISGKNPHWNPEVTEKFFSYLHDPYKPSIFDGEMFNQEVLPGKAPVRDTRKVDEIGTLPNGVVDAKSAYEHARLNPGWVAGEHYIKEDPRFSFLYARDVLKGPFTKGEAAIATVPAYEGQYRAFLKRRTTAPV